MSARTPTQTPTPLFRTRQSPNSQTINKKQKNKKKDDPSRNNTSAPHPHPLCPSPHPSPSFFFLFFFPFFFAGHPHVPWGWENGVMAPGFMEIGGKENTAITNHGVHDRYQPPSGLTATKEAPSHSTACKKMANLLNNCTSSWISPRACGGLEMKSQYGGNVWKSNPYDGTLDCQWVCFM